MSVRYLTKQQMIQKLEDLARQGWVQSIRPLNSGGIGNTIDHILGLPENNLPISDTAQWELKTHRIGSPSLLTLFHMEPQPREYGVVTNLLLPNFGWADQTRGNELSFRQTIQATRVSDRGFSVIINHSTEKVIISFNEMEVAERHGLWLDSVRTRRSSTALQPEPYWTFRELFLKVSTKLLNAFFVKATAHKEAGIEFFKICELQILQGLDLDHFINALENGNILIDFDARSHHNHGTKFRIRQNLIPELYRYVDTVSYP